MKEIFDYIVNYKGELSFWKLCIWCGNNNKLDTLQAYQSIIIELVKEHNRKK